MQHSIRRLTMFMGTPQRLVQTLRRCGCITTRLTGILGWSSMMRTLRGLAHTTTETCKGGLWRGTTMLLRLGAGWILAIITMTLLGLGIRRTMCGIIVGRLRRSIYSYRAAHF